MYLSDYTFRVCVATCGIFAVVSGDFLCGGATPQGPHNEGQLLLTADVTPPCMEKETFLKLCNVHEKITKYFEIHSQYHRDLLCMKNDLAISKSLRFRYCGIILNRGGQFS